MSDADEVDCMIREYQCYMCGGIFSTDQTEDEAMAESQQDFPLDDLTKEDCALVCNPCYKTLARVFSATRPTEFFDSQGHGKNL